MIPALALLGTTALVLGYMNDDAISCALEDRRIEQIYAYCGLTHGTFER